MEVREVRGEVLTTSSGAGRQVMKLHGYKRRRVWDRPLWSVMCMGQGVRRGLVTATDQWSKGGGVRMECGSGQRRQGLAVDLLAGHVEG